MIPDVIDILLVEDDPADEELTLHSLRKARIVNNISVVHDGAEALDFIFRTGPYTQREALNPKLILLDLKLPKVDGLEVLQRIKADPATRMIPVVVFTSSQEERDIINSYRLGSNSYISNLWILTRLSRLCSS
jgi:two-component system, response regulator